MIASSFDWPAIVRTLTDQTLAASLRRLDPLIASQLVDLDLWLFDYQHRMLRSVRTGEEQRPGALEDSAPIRSVTSLEHHGERLGFATAVQFDNEDEGADGNALGHLAPLLAAAVTTSNRFTDTIAVARRRRELSLAAELHWSLLPPTRFTLGPYTVTAAIEPAYETGGDVFDFAEHDGHLVLAVLDVMGHGLQAALVSSAALAGLRRARRGGLALVDIAAEVDLVVKSLPSRHFVSAVLADLDLASGQGTYLSAGHLAPLVVSRGEVRELEVRPTLPLGVTIGTAGSSPVLGRFQIHSDETLILYSDGIIENQLTDSGQPGGYDHFAQLLAATLSAPGGPGHAAREVIEALLEFTGPELRDDATLLMVQIH